MIEGIFQKKYFFNIFLFLAGMFFIGFYFLVLTLDTNSPKEIIILIILGILYCSASVISMLFNHHAYLRINNQHLCAKYRWFKKIEIDFSEIDFSSSAMGSLTLYLKNGTHYTITGLKNETLISSFIRKHIHFSTDQSLDDLFSKFSILKNKWKRNLIFAYINLGLFILSIIICFCLTGDKEFYEFTNQDWINTSFFLILCILSFILAFYFAFLTQNTKAHMNQIQYKLQRTMIQSAPLSDKNITHVFTDEMYSFRLCFMSVPDSQNFYYSVEKFDKSLSLTQIYISKIYKNKEDFFTEFEEDPEENFLFDKLIEIPLH